MEKFINQLLNKDCLEIMSQLEDECIDLIVTDPPYLINYSSGRYHEFGHRFKNPILNDNNPTLIEESIKEMFRVLKNNSAAYIFCSQDKVEIFKKYITEAGFIYKNLIVWIKNNWTCGDLKCAYRKQYECCFYVNKGKKELKGKMMTDVWDWHNIPGLKRVVGGGNCIKTKNH